MDSIKSIEYLKEIIKNLGKAEATDALENIAYLLWDNNYYDARFFIEQLIEIVEEL